MATIVSNDSSSNAVITGGLNGGAAIPGGSTFPIVGSSGGVKPPSGSTSGGSGSDALPGGSLSALPGGTTVSGTDTVIPQDVLNSVSSGQVTNFKLWIAGAVLLLLVFMVVWFAYDKAGSVIDIAKTVAHKI